MKRHGRVDSNQAEIVEYLRARGARVQSLADVGGGVPDLLVCYQGRLMLGEVKDGAKPQSERELTDDQRRWWALWDDRTIWRIESTADAEAMLELMSIW